MSLLTFNCSYKQLRPLGIHTCPSSLVSQSVTEGDIFSISTDMSFPSSLRTLFVLCGAISTASALLGTHGISVHHQPQFAVPVYKSGPHPKLDTQNNNHHLQPRQTQWTVGQAVQTTSGLISGHSASNLTDVSEYLGIPYAEPPIGTLRFQPPVRFDGGTNPFNASAFSPSCYASPVTNTTPNPSDYVNMTLTPTASDLLTVMYGATALQSEDCLTLNIWTPGLQPTPYPVLIFLHGGGYTSGGTAIPWYNGQFLSGKESLVVVTLNYRLSIFGFPGNPLSRTNLGLLDQRLAVEWVRDNIAAFGGDPARMTLFGQSAGGGSVDHYSYAWADDPIVAGLIPMSGTAVGLGLPKRETGVENWFNTTAAAGCGNNTTSDPQAVYECMLLLPADRIVGNITRLFPTSTESGLPFSPTIDDRLVFSNYTDRKPAALPLLIGNTDSETGFFRLLAPTLPDLIWPLINDLVFDCPVAARALANGNPNVWRYRWFGDFPNLKLSVVPPSGSWHASDLPMLFNTTPTALIPDTPQQQEIGVYMRGAWAAFARDPVEGLVGYGWPRYEADKETLVRLAWENRTGANLGMGRMYDAGCTVGGEVDDGASAGNGGGDGSDGGGGTADSVPTGKTGGAGRVKRQSNFALWVALVVAGLFVGERRWMLYLVGVLSLVS